MSAGWVSRISPALPITWFVKDRLYCALHVKGLSKFRESLWVGCLVRIACSLSGRFWLSDRAWSTLLLLIRFELEDLRSYLVVKLQSDCGCVSWGRVVATMSCLCAPTTHAGSFRCRLHRSSSLSGRSMTIRLISGEDLEISTASLIENSLKTRGQTSQLKPVVSLPASPLRIPKSRSPVQRGSRLRNMVSRSDEDDEAPKQSVLITWVSFHPAFCATGDASLINSNLFSRRNRIK